MVIIRDEVCPLEGYSTCRPAPLAHHAYMTTHAGPAHGGTAAGHSIAPGTCS